MSQPGCTMFLVLAVALVNLCLGYGLAVKLGLGPPSLAEAWAVLMAGCPIQVEGPAAASGADLPQAAQGPSPDDSSAGWLLQELVLPPDWKETGKGGGERPTFDGDNPGPEEPIQGAAAPADRTGDCPGGQGGAQGA